MKQPTAEALEARDELRALLPPGTRVYTQLEHRTQSGMTRWIIPRVIAPDQSGEPYPRYLAGLIELADIGWKRTRQRDGLEVGGCGMDMGFHLVYSISRSLYPDGFECIGQGDDNWRGRCPSNDHSNGDRDYSPHHHRDGGYALRHQWL